MPMTRISWKFSNLLSTKGCTWNSLGCQLLPSQYSRTEVNIYAKKPHRALNKFLVTLVLYTYKYTILQ